MTVVCLETQQGIVLSELKDLFLCFFTYHSISFTDVVVSGLSWNPSVPTGATQLHIICPPVLQLVKWFLFPWTFLLYVLQTLFLPHQPTRLIPIMHQPCLEYQPNCNTICFGADGWKAEPLRDYWWSFDRQQVWLPCHFFPLQAVLSVFFIFFVTCCNIILLHFITFFLCSVGINYFIFMSSTWQLLREAHSGLLFGQDLKIEICNAWTFLTMTRPRCSRYK